MEWWKAVALGIVEGVTEFLPISSTGHLILVSAAIDYPEAQRATFEIFIQLGAVLAIVWHYREHLSSMIRWGPRQGAGSTLLAKVTLAFLPAAFVGFLFHRAIEQHLFHPFTVAVSLVVGGLVLLWVDRRPMAERARCIENVCWTQALVIGLAQTLSLVPGVSRAAATIVGGLAVGLDRPVATQFSFYLSIPTLGAASIFSVYKARHQLMAADAAALALGFTAAFVSAVLVVRGFVWFIERHTFRVFAYYRMALGILVLVLLA